MTTETKTDVQSAYSILVNSRNRLEGSVSSSNFHFQIDLPAGHTYNRVAVKNGLIPKSYFIVPSDANTFTLQEGAQQAQVTVPAGNYSRVSFMKALPPLLNAASPTGLQYSVTYPNTTSAADTGKFSYTCSGAASFIIGDSLYEQLGFDAGSTQVLPCTSTNVVSFIEKQCLVLHSDLIDGHKDDILAVFQVGADPPFSFSVFQCYDIRMNARKLGLGVSNGFVFTLTDEDFAVVNLNGLDLVFELVFFTE